MPTRFACHALLSLVSASALVSTAAAQSPVVINEFCYDEEGRDEAEFVELHNRSAQAVDVSAWTLTAEDARGESVRYVLPARTVLAPGGFYVLGSRLMPQVDQVVGTDAILPDTQHALVLRDGASGVVDAVDYETWQSTWRAAPTRGEGIWPEFQSRKARPMSWQRARDGRLADGARNFLLRPRTPGGANTLQARELREDFDTLREGAALASFAGSFGEPRVIDPTKPSAYNPAPLPASPQGGNAAVFWDERGGGNTSVLLADAVQDVVFEAYVWIDARPLGIADRAMWSIGVRGGSGPFYDFMNVSASQLQDVKNGNTGVSWTYEANDRGATLYLVEHGDGGWGSGARTPPRVLAKIPLRVGVDDGWQRLRLELRGTALEAFFGGSYLCADGQRVRATVANASGGVYMSYRERIALPTQRRPLTCDRLRIAPSAARLEYFGSALATSAGLPRLRTAMPAMAGRDDFVVIAEGLVPRGTSLLLFGLDRLKPPVDLAIVGARVQTYVYVDALTFTPGVADASGRVNFGFPMPCLPGLPGAKLRFQMLDFDAALNLAFPVGTSRAMELTVER